MPDRVRGARRLRAVHAPLIATLCAVLTGIRSGETGDYPMVQFIEDDSARDKES